MKKDIQSRVEKRIHQKLTSRLLMKIIPVPAISFFFATAILIDEASKMWPLVLAILLGSSLSKFASGWLASRWLGFSNYKSTLIGVTSIPQLITTLAVVLVGQSLEIISPELSVAIIILSITTTLISPIITTRLLNMKPDSYLR